MVKELLDLEQMAVKLQDAARKLSPGPDRHALLQEIGRFRVQIVFCDIPNQVQQPQRLGIRRFVVAGAEGEAAGAEAPGSNGLQARWNGQWDKALWVGDCTDSAELRGAAAASETTPPSLPERARGAISPGMKQ